MENKKRLIEIPADGIIRIPIMDGNSTVGERIIDLSNLPTVNAVEMVHGRWKRTPISGTLFCSACDKIPELQIETNYCPNCGAKMDGDKS